MASHQTKNVVVLGASGAVGAAVVQALLNASFQVSAVIRSSSSASFPPTVKIFQTDYTHDSLVQAFHSQDAIVSTLATSSLSLQRTLIDAAIASGVRHFLPSEYGVDSSSEAASAVLPVLESKISIVNYLKTRQNEISWSVLVTGCLFDWCFDVPPFGGWDLNKREATIFDGGDVPFEATTMAQLGQGVVAILENLDLTANQYVYINSFTTTQNEVLKALKSSSGSEKWNVTHALTESTWKGGMARIQRGGDETGQGLSEVITSAYYGYGGLNHYSVRPGLWNKRLGLPVEELDRETEKVVMARS